MGLWPMGSLSLWFGFRCLVLQSSPTSCFLSSRSAGRLR
jgi:hypothetical protein